MEKKKKDNNRDDNSLKSSKDALRKYARYSSLSLQMLVVMGVCLWGGIKLDHYLEFKFPLFTLMGAIGGVVLAIYYAVKDFMGRK